MSTVLETPRHHAVSTGEYLGRGGECLVRYDNESGKGDHRHVGGKEALCRFVSVAQLRRDFEADVEKYGGKDEAENQD